MADAGVAYRALLGIAVSGITAAVTVYIIEESLLLWRGCYWIFLHFGEFAGGMSGRVLQL